MTVPFSMMIAVGAPLLAAWMQLVASTATEIGAADRRLARPYIRVALCQAAWCARIGFQSLPGFVELHPILIRALGAGLHFLPAASFHLTCCWANKTSRLSKVLIAAAWLSGLGLATLDYTGLMFDGWVVHPWGAFGRAGEYYIVLPVVLGVWCFANIVVTVDALRHAETRHAKLRLTYWLLAVFLLILAGGSNVLVNQGYLEFAYGGLGSVFAAALMILGVARHSLIEIDALVMKAAGWALALLLIASPPLATTLHGLGADPATGGLALFGLAIGSLLTAGAVFATTRRHVESTIERAIFRARHQARSALRRFTDDIHNFQSIEAMAPPLVDMLMTSFSLNGAAFYLRRNATSDFRLASSEGHILAPVTLPAGLKVQPIDESPSPAGFSPWDVLVPIQNNRVTLGLLAMAPKQPVGVFDDIDYGLLALLASQVSVVMQNRDFASEIERQQSEIRSLLKQIESDSSVASPQLLDRHAQFDEIVGKSAALQRVLDVASRVADSTMPILVTGETGTGKELLARAIHRLSARADRNFVCVNCPAIPAELAESLLFGHSRGAFTGAAEAQEGLFESADGGTVFLDEVGDLPPHIQVKLLRVLQEGEIQRLGGRGPRKLDLRIVSATNRDLQTEVRQGRFREDLFHRLAGMTLELPPLRARADDIPALASVFLERALEKYRRPLRGFSNDAIEALCAHPWPGNIRELQHVIEKAVLLCTTDLIRGSQLAELGIRSRVETPSAVDLDQVSLTSHMREEKIRHVLDALERSGGNQAAAARLLGMSRSNLNRLLKRYGLKPDGPAIQ